ncbi:MAG: LLM class flavin-dependent oxidoreductase [Acidimicrobiia bacterium]|nr:LLM class flavin-dependent oxidoreductase [Acidimicrobiia bacterium]
MTESRPAAAEPGLGVALACGPADALDLAVRAEQAGFDSVWTTEFSWRSATVPMAAIAVATSRITIGSAIAYALGRTPAVLAAEARDIDELSDGRLILGLGSAQPSRIRDWLGIEPTDVTGRVAEVVEAVQALWHIGPEPVQYRGRHVSVTVGATPGAYPSRSARLPVLLAAVNRRMVHVAGAVADGLIAHPIVDGSALRELMRPQLEAAAAAADRQQPPMVAAMLIAVVNDDEEAARRDAAAQIAFYAQHAAYAPLMSHYGFEPAAAGIRAAAADDWAAAVSAVTDTMVDRLAVAGPAQLVRRLVTERLATRDCATLILHTPSMLMSDPAARASGDPGRTYREHVGRLIDAFGASAGR